MNVLEGTLHRDGDDLPAVLWLVTELHRRQLNTPDEMILNRATQKIDRILDRVDEVITTRCPVTKVPTGKRVDAMSALIWKELEFPDIDHRKPLSSHTLSIANINSAKYQR